MIELELFSYFHETPDVTEFCSGLIIPPNRPTNLNSEIIVDLGRTVKEILTMLNLLED